MYLLIIKIIQCVVDALCGQDTRVNSVHSTESDGVRACVRAHVSRRGADEQVYEDKETYSERGLQWRGDWNCVKE